MPHVHLNGFHHLLKPGMTADQCLAGAVGLMRAARAKLLDQIRVLDESIAALQGPAAAAPRPRRKGGGRPAPASFRADALGADAARAGDDDGAPAPAAAAATDAAPPGGAVPAADQPAGSRIRAAKAAPPVRRRRGPGDGRRGRGVAGR